MKKICGFKFNSKNAFLVTLEGTREIQNILTKEVLTFPSGQSPARFVEWALTQLELVLDHEKPHTIAYKLSASLDKHDQIFHIYFGLAMLNLAAQHREIPINHVAPQSLRPKAFGLAKLDSVDEYIKAKFSDQSSPWNANIREALSVALLRLIND